MIGSTSRFGIAVAFAGLLALVPAGTMAQELSTTLTDASTAPQQSSARPAGVAPLSGPALVPSSLAEDEPDAGSRVGAGDVLLAIGGILVAGALTDYVTDAPHWSLTATQAGLLGGGALVASLGGLLSGEARGPSGGPGTSR